MSRPGVYDAWITREPEWDEAPLWPTHRCDRCARWLKERPERSENWEHTEHCDGQPVVFTDHYTEDDAGILNIIGWDHLGKEYHSEYPPICNNATPHAPHEAVMEAGAYEFRTCAHCGHLNKEVVW